MAIKQTTELENMLQEASDRGASDIHLVPGEPVAYRVNGQMVRAESDPLTADDVMAVAVAAVGEKELARVGPVIESLRTSCSLPGVLDARLTVGRAQGGYTVTIAILPDAILALEQIGFSSEVIEAMESDQGLVIIAGRIGSGRSTTALSVLDHINERKAAHICTVEDPITGYLTPKQSIVTQHEVGVDVPNTVAGIRTATQQDVDVLMVGSLKTPDEIDACLAVASLGRTVVHIVMNATTAEDAIERLVAVHELEARPDFRKALARELRVVCAQHLLVRQDEQGRVPAHSILVPDEAARKAIAAGDSIGGLGAVGSIALADHLRALQEAGVINEEQVSETMAKV